MANGSFITLYQHDSWQGNRYCNNSQRGWWWVKKIGIGFCTGNNVFSVFLFYKQKCLVIKNCENFKESMSPMKCAIGSNCPPAVSIAVTIVHHVNFQSTHRKIHTHTPTHLPQWVVHYNPLLFQTLFEHDKCICQHPHVVHCQNKG